MAGKLIFAFVIALLALCAWSVSTGNDQGGGPGTLDIVLRHG